MGMESFREIIAYSFYLFISFDDRKLYIIFRCVVARAFINEEIRKQILLIGTVQHHDWAQEIKFAKYLIVMESHQ